MKASCALKLSCDVCYLKYDSKSKVNSANVLCSTQQLTNCRVAKIVPKIHLCVISFIMMTIIWLNKLNILHCFHLYVYILHYMQLPCAGVYLPHSIKINNTSLWDLEMCSEVKVQRKCPYFEHLKKINRKNKVNYWCTLLLPKNKPQFFL